MIQTADRPIGSIPAAQLTLVRFSANGTQILSGLTLSLEAGLIHGIAGRGGSGRTTLLKVLGTLLVPDSGTVRILGTDPASCGYDELADVRSRIGFQFQNLGLFDSLDVLDNVLFSLTGGTPETASARQRDMAMRALEQVGLGTAAARETGHLSGGMQRRLAIARAFASDKCSLVLFDDPIGGLDPVTSARIMNLVAGAGHDRSGRTIVIAGNDTGSLMKHCDLIHVIDGGVVVWSGRPDEMASSAEIAVRRLLGSNRGS